MTPVHSLIQANRHNQGRSRSQRKNQLWIIAWTAYPQKNLPRYDRAPQPLFQVPARIETKKPSAPGHRGFRRFARPDRVRAGAGGFLRGRLQNLFDRDYTATIPAGTRHRFAREASAFCTATRPTCCRTASARLRTPTPYRPASTTPESVPSTPISRRAGVPATFR